MKYLKCSIGIQILAITFCSLLWADSGKVILLVGTSTAGKSTLFKKLKEREQSIVDYGVDRFAIDYVATLVQKYFPNEYTVLNDAIGSNKILGAFYCSDEIRPNLKPGFEEKEVEIQKIVDSLKMDNLVWTMLSKFREDPFLLVKFAYEKKIRGIPNWNKMVEEVVEQAENGKTLFVDVVDYPRFEQLLKRLNVPVVKVLAFCPFSELLKRILVRNDIALKTNNKCDLRTGGPIRHFSELYKRKTRKDELTLGIIRREEIDEAFNKYFLDAPAEKTKFLKAFGFTSPTVTEVEITTRFKVDEDTLIINTATTTDPEVEILNKLNLI